MTRTSRAATGCLVLGVVVGLLIAAQPGTSQGQQERETSRSSSLAEMMAGWSQANALGPEHKHMAETSGTWDAQAKMWFAPGMPPMETTGVAEFRVVLDGHILEQRYTCDSPQMPFKGLGYTAYDGTRKKYVSIWMDSMCNGVSVMDGTADASGKVFTYYGTMDDPVTGEDDMMSRMVLREVTADKTILESYVKPAGKDEYKSMEIVYTRRN